MSEVRRTVLLLTVGLWVVLPSAVRADTVYLKNGAYIDGVVQARADGTIEVQIGDVGKVEIKAEDIYEIERNSRTGKTVDRSAEHEEALKQFSREERTRKILQEDPSDGGSVREASGPPSNAESLVAKEDAIDPELESRIQELVQELQRQKARNRTRAERQLKTIGSPAVPYVLPAMKAEGELVRISAFRVISEIADDRAIDACLDGLRDPNEFVRDLASRTLVQVTKQDFGYQPQASPRRREQAYEKWSQWWSEEKQRREEALQESKDAESKADETPADET